MMSYANGAEGDRTPDLLTASQVLSQLSYCPKAGGTLLQAWSLVKIYLNNTTHPIEVSAHRYARYLHRDATIS